MKHEESSRAVQLTNDDEIEVLAPPLVAEECVEIPAAAAAPTENVGVEMSLEAIHAVNGTKDEEGSDQTLMHEEVSAELIDPSVAVKNQVKSAAVSKRKSFHLFPKKIKKTPTKKTSNVSTKTNRSARIERMTGLVIEDSESQAAVTTLPSLEIKLTEKDVLPNGASVQDEREVKASQSEDSSAKSNDRAVTLVDCEFKNDSKSEPSHKATTSTLEPIPRPHDVATPLQPPLVEETALPKELVGPPPSDDDEIQDLAPPSDIIAEEPMSQNGVEAKLARPKGKVGERTVSDKVEAGESRDAENTKTDVQDYIRLGPSLEPANRNTVKRILSMMGSRGSAREVTPAFDIDETVHESAVDDSEENDSTSEELTFDDSLVTIDDYSFDSTLVLATDAQLDELAKEQEQESDEEVDELIKSALVGFENEEIDKELREFTHEIEKEREEFTREIDDVRVFTQEIEKGLRGFTREIGEVRVNTEGHTCVSLLLGPQTITDSIADRVMSTDLQKEAEGFLANLVDKLDYFAPRACGRSCRNNYDDSSVVMASIRSAGSGSVKKPELMKSTIVGVEKEQIEKELQDKASSVSIADGAMTTDLREEDKGFLASLGGKLDVFAPFGCGRSCGNNYDDSSVAKASSIIISLNPSMDQLLSLVGDDNDSLTVDTGYDDESLVSDYDDFNKAMLMLKNRAARHRLSEVRLLDKVKMEQQRRQSIGLSPTMIEI